MKILFFISEELRSANGISKKIINQCEGLRNNGAVVELCFVKQVGGEYFFYVNDTPICYLGKSRRTMSILGIRCKLHGLSKYIIDNQFDLVYVRYVHTATPFLIRFLKRLKQKGIRVFFEIPTYPYDFEYSNSNYLRRLLLKIENISRGRFRKYVDRVVTVQEYDSILGIPTVRISNGVSIEDIPLRTPVGHKAINLIGVANMQNWHGYDRLICGIGQYYKNGGRERIDLYLIGSSKEVIGDYSKVVDLYGINDYIHFEGPKEGRELDLFFDKADLAIGSLGFHRIGLTEGKSLKCIEYAARGIPFIYSNINIDFDDKDYVMRVPADDSPIDIEKILHFINIQVNSPLDIRNSIGVKATWEYQMSLVINEANKL